jgi:hypothetical protein
MAGRLLLLSPAVAALATALVIASDCDAADGFQFVMLFVLPPVTGAFVGATLRASLRTRGRTLLGIYAAILAAGAAWVVIAVVWVAHCEG